MNTWNKLSIKDIILDSIAEGVFTVDRDFTINYFNRRAEFITGISREKAIGCKCYDVFRVNICNTNCALKNAIKDDAKYAVNNVDIINSKGKKVPISINASVLKDDNGNILGGVETFLDQSEVSTLRKTIKAGYSSEDIISQNKQIHDMLDILPDIAESTSTVLIEGDSGTGKELIARAIHNLSGRKGRFVAVNCASLPESLIESELFGYEKGAFTDAKKNKPGRFALAKGGTLFLDEIGELPGTVQSKLLRVLQEKVYEPLGGEIPIPTDARIVSATNRNLKQRVEEKAFRQDLFYRLNVIKLLLPPLNQRKEDIPLLIEHFINKMNAITGKNIQSVSEDALELLTNYDYPGNIRELENVIEYAFVMCKERVIEPKYLSKDIITNQKTVNHNTFSEQYPRFGLIEKDQIVDALHRSYGKKSKAAELLGVNRSTLWRQMKKHHMV
ncbi:MAG: sigma 54-interacting transcriptional regulator [Fibrobacteria bacterium]|nr:sigma 54-interacting transcriptional regulator [Fibrobacteria bacterium]